MKLYSENHTELGEVYAELNSDGYYYLKTLNNDGGSKIIARFIPTSTAMYCQCPHNNSCGGECWRDHNFIEQ